MRMRPAVMACWRFIVLLSVFGCPVAEITDIRFNNTTPGTKNGVLLFKFRQPNELVDTWLFVCFHGDPNTWGKREAIVACRQLGFRGGWPTSHVMENGDQQSQYLYNIDCDGNEEKLKECRHDITNQCRESKVAGVYCYRSFDVNIIGGTAPNIGRLEVKYDDAWSDVCHVSKQGETRQWTIYNAQVVCEELGYPGTMMTMRGGAGHGNSTSTVGGYKCREDLRDSSLQDCLPDSLAGSAQRSSCDYKHTGKDNYAVVACAAPGYIGCFNMKAITAAMNRTRLQSTSLYINLCRSHCRQHNHTLSYLYRGDTCFCDDINNNVKTSDRDCRQECSGNGFESCGGYSTMSIYDVTDGICPNLWNTSDVFYFGHIMTSSDLCGTGMKTVGASALQCVPRKSLSQVVWNDTIPQCTAIIIEDNGNYEGGIGWIIKVIVIILVPALVLVVMIIVILCARKSGKISCCSYGRDYILKEYDVVGKGEAPEIEDGKESLPMLNPQYGEASGSDKNVIDRAFELVEGFHPVDEIKSLLGLDKEDTNECNIDAKRESASSQKETRMIHVDNKGKGLDVEEGKELQQPRSPQSDDTNKSEKDFVDKAVDGIKSVLRLDKKDTTENDIVAKRESASSQAAAPMIQMDNKGKVSDVEEGKELQQPRSPQSDNANKSEKDLFDKAVDGIKSVLGLDTKDTTKSNKDAKLESASTSEMSPMVPAGSIKGKPKEEFKDNDSELKIVNETREVSPKKKLPSAQVKSETNQQETNDSKSDKESKDTKDKVNKNSKTNKNQDVIAKNRTDLSKNTQIKDGNGNVTNDSKQRNTSSDEQEKRKSGDGKTKIKEEPGKSVDQDVNPATLTCSGNPGDADKEKKLTRSESAKGQLDKLVKTITDIACIVKPTPYTGTYDIDEETDIGQNRNETSSEIKTKNNDENCNGVTTPSTSDLNQTPPVACTGNSDQKADSPLSPSSKGESFLKRVFSFSSPNEKKDEIQKAIELSNKARETECVNEDDTSKGDESRYSKDKDPKVTSPSSLAQKGKFDSHNGSSLNKDKRFESQKPPEDNKDVLSEDDILTDYSLSSENLHSDPKASTKSPTKAFFSNILKRSVSKENKEESEQKQDETSKENVLKTKVSSSDQKEDAPPLSPNTKVMSSDQKEDAPHLLPKTDVSSSDQKEDAPPRSPTRSKIDSDNSDSKPGSPTSPSSKGKSGFKNTFFRKDKKDEKQKSIEPPHGNKTREADENNKSDTAKTSTSKDKEEPALENLDQKIDLHSPSSEDKTVIKKGKKNEKHEPMKLPPKYNKKEYHGKDQGDKSKDHEEKKQSESPLVNKVSDTEEKSKGDTSTEGVSGDHRQPSDNSQTGLNKLKARILSRSSSKETKDPKSPHGHGEFIRPNESDTIDASVFQGGF